MPASTHSKAAAMTQPMAQKSNEQKTTGKKQIRKKPVEKKTDKKKKSNENDEPNCNFRTKSSCYDSHPLIDVTTAVNNTQHDAREMRRPATGASHSKNHKETDRSTRDNCVDTNLEPYNRDADLEAPIIDDFDGPTDDDRDEEDRREFTSAPRNYSSGRDVAEAVDMRRSPKPQRTSVEDRPRVPNLPSDPTIEDDDEPQGPRVQASRSNRNASQEVNARSQLRVDDEDADNGTTNKRKNGDPRHLKRGGNVWEHDFYDNDGKHGDSADGDYYDYDDNYQENDDDFPNIVDDGAESDVVDDDNPEESQQGNSRGKRSRRLDNNEETCYDLSELDLGNETNPFISFSPDGLIAKPAGEPSRATRGKKRGYCLRRAMSYPPELPKDHPGSKNKTWKGKNKAYNSIHLCARQVVLSPISPFLQQKPSCRVKAEKVWVAKFPQFSSTYERNWPMNIMFSTIMQNNKKRKQKAKASKTSEGDDKEKEEEEEDNTFTILLPGGKVLGKVTDEFNVPSSSTLGSSPGPAPRSTHPSRPNPANGACVFSEPWISAAERSTGQGEENRIQKKLLLAKSAKAERTTTRTLMVPSRGRPPQNKRQQVLDGEDEEDEA
ncbi:hypothetical protein FRB90_012474 [Tulasnella sp. 427]|nr:hypothetical protein FRB90_012474 [Tulasnella sp. 427]